jgi:selenocysteine lyase/cysteine desulfurase
VTAAVDFLAGLDPAAHGSRRERLASSYRALHEHESRLLDRLETGLAELPGVTSWSRAERRTPTVLVTFDRVAAIDVTTALAARQVLAPSSNFYALEASRRLGLGDEGGLRMGLAPYSTESDVDRVLEGLRLSLEVAAAS